MKHNRSKPGEGEYAAMSMGERVYVRKLETPDEKREVSRRILADLGDRYR